MPNTEPSVPESERPKVAASAIAGALASVTIWAWNNWFPEFSPWHANDLIVGAWVTFVTGITGPLIRRLQKWGEGDKRRQDEVRALREDVRALAEAMKSKGQP